MYVMPLQYDDQPTSWRGNLETSWPWPSLFLRRVPVLRSPSCGSLGNETLVGEFHFVSLPLFSHPPGLLHQENVSPAGHCDAKPIFLHGLQCRAAGPMWFAAPAITSKTQKQGINY